jgi:tRNA(Ile)-lysidine synthase
VDLPSHVHAFLDAQGLAGTAGVVAVSGGPDSVALAHVLFRLRRQDALSGLVVAHVNHRLRGLESDADEQFVLGLPAEWCSDDTTLLTARVLRVDTAAEAHSRGENLEAAARDLRYAWLAQVAREEAAAWVAVGHTADDQAETVLFRLLRGSGLEGLCGMATRRPLEAPIDLLRPLLRIRRQQVLDYVEQEGLGYRQDRSNLDRGFTRNRLRHELIPRLQEEYNPALVDVLCRIAEQARDVQAEIRPLAEELLACAELPRAGTTLVFRADILRTAPPHRLREMFRLVWQREAWPQGDMGFEDWQRLAAVVRGDVTASDLPGGLHVRHTARIVQVIPPLRGS